MDYKLFQGLFSSTLEFEKFLKWEEENAEHIKRVIEVENSGHIDVRSLLEGVRPPPPPPSNFRRRI